MSMFEFQSLTSCDNAELKGYKEAFEYAFNDNKIRNIALTGSYGAGKSSVLETYEKELLQCGDTRGFMHISLAKFEQVNDTESGEEIKDKANVEGKILNQLIYQLSDDAIRKSLVNVNINPEKNDLRCWTEAIFLFLISIFYFITLSWERTFSFPLDFINYIIDERRNIVLFTLCLGTLLVGIYLLIYYLTHKQMKYHIFRKICIKENEIDLFPNDEDRSGFYFDKYMNEVCELFLDAKKEVFVFEDLDRYDSTYIFEKLRELNSILNIKSSQNYEKKQRNNFTNWICQKFMDQKPEEYRPIRFMYLVRDDIFTQTDRTKFFDFIIPVVPIISGHNSYAMVEQYLSSKNMEEELPFIKQITLYVNDMRLLKNIVNEYQIYYENIGEIFVGRTFRKMFSLLVFKNLFPQDYIELQTDRGVIVEMIRQKSKMCKIKREELELEIVKLQEEIVEKKRLVEQTFIQHEKELNAMLFPTIDQYRVNGKTEEQYENRIEFVTDLMNHVDQVYKYNAYRREYIKDNYIVDTIQKMKTSKQYQEMLRDIEKITEAKDHDIDEMSTLIVKKQQLIEKLKRNTLKDYIDVYGFESLWTDMPESITKDDVWKDKNNIELLRMLVTNGYIDESYGDFISVFHESDIRSSDMKYIRSVLDGDPLDMAYSVCNPKEVSTYLDDNNLSSPFARNIDMFCFYFSNGTTKQKHAIIDAINKFEQIDFINALLLLPYLYSNWIPDMMVYSPDLLWQVSEYYPKEATKMLLTTLLSPSRDMVSEHYDDVDVSSLLDTMDFVSIFQEVFHHETMQIDHSEDAEDSSDELVLDMEECVELAIQEMCRLGFKLSAFLPDLVNAPEISWQIYENDMYEITLDNMYNILNTFYFDGENKVDINVLYDQICKPSEKSLQPICRYINDNIPDFIMCKLDSEAMWNEDSTNMTEIINGANSNQVDDIIKRMKCPIKDAKEIYPIERLNKVIKGNKLAYNVENIFDYFEMWNDAQTYHEQNETGQEVDNCLLIYLDQYPESELTNKKTYFKRVYDKFQSEHENDDISKLFNFVAYDSLMQETKYTWLVKSLNRVWYNSIPHKVPVERLPILFENQIVKMSKSGLEDARALNTDLLYKYILSDVYKYVCIMEEVDEVNIEELAFLLKNDFSDVKANTYIQDTTLENMDALLAYDARMTKKWAVEFILNHNELLSQEQRVKLFISNIKQFNKIDMIDIFNSEDWPVPATIFEGKNPIIKKSNIVEGLIAELEKHKLIGKVKKDKKNPGYIRIYSLRGK
ncbi:MAG: hypothetical protein ACI4F4_09695 [Lachnospiraceae bacterium]